MPSITEQITAAAQTTLTNPMTVISALSQTAFGSIEKLIALNLATAKHTIGHSSMATKQLFSIKKPEELLALSKTQVQPQIDELMSYARELAEISNQARSEFLQALGQSSQTATKIVRTKSIAPVAAQSLTIDSPVSTSAPTANTQLPLLVEISTKVTPKTKATMPADKPAPALKKPATVSATSETKAALIKASDAEVVTATPVEKSSPKKTAKPSAPEPIKMADAAEVVAVTPPQAKPVVEKKSAVKMPFPASPVKQATKPSFPTVSTRPAYKAKGSAATGAKKPVRQ